MLTVKLVVLLLVLVPLVKVNGDIADGATDDLSKDNFDFIIVGTGASGSVLAKRLSSETPCNVLVLEGGVLGTGQRDIGGTDYVAAYFKPNPSNGAPQTLDTPVTRYDVPGMYNSIRLASSVLDNVWNISAVGPFFGQAKIIGGNQASNGMAWIIPQKKDLDDWNIPGFNSTEFWPYFQKIENATDTGYGPPRGTSGPIHIQNPTFLASEQHQFLAACLAAGYVESGDPNNGVLIPGVSLSQENIKAGIRQSTSITYLATAIANPNLKVRTGSTVTKVIFDSLVATGVEYYDSCGNIKQAYATKEVILAAGTLQTTKILFNSGIGPESVLDAFGKPHVVVNNVIGQKIRNHQRVLMDFTDTTRINPNLYATPSVTVEYASTGTGILEATGGYTLNFWANHTHPYPDVSSTAIYVAGNSPSSLYSQGFSVTVSLNNNVYANGTVNLTSTDPLAPILFTANVFLLNEDVTTLAEGILGIRKVMAEWDGDLTENAPGPSLNTVAELIPWIRSNPGTDCHYYGAVPMGTTSSSPLDPRMRVQGVTGLRVVGPAVIPNEVYPGMQALAIALGEKGTDLILEDYSL